MSRAPRRLLDSIELLERLERGPCFIGHGETMTRKEAEERVKLWLDSWITPPVKRLIPELAKHLKEKAEREANKG